MNCRTLFSGKHNENVQHVFVWRNKINIYLDIPCLELLFIYIFQVFIDRFRYNANRASQVQSKLKLLEKL